MPPDGLCPLDTKLDLRETVNQESEFQSKFRVLTACLVIKERVGVKMLLRNVGKL